MKGKLLRWAAPLLAGLVFFLLLGLCLFLHTRAAEATVTFLVGGAMKAAPVRAFALRFAGTILVPFYLAAGLVLWVLALAWAQALRPGYSRIWTAREGFGLTLSALLWTHLWLWWQVPATLWLLPGLARIPFWLLLPLLAGLSLAYPLVWALRARLGAVRTPLLVGGWLLLWTLLPAAPGMLPRLLTPAKGGPDTAKILVIGLDGLREDVGHAATTRYAGTPYPHTYTVIPATRLLWHILWGGDPLTYTVGHVSPDLEEFKRTDALPLVDLASFRGWRPRFYIDDGGTIGLVGRMVAFDDLLMPAPGWENFINSNLSASFPLFAAWENWGRAFPTTNPWAPLDSGLREALRLGRGSKWVMFHSCLAHVPIYLRRNELAQIHHWWALPPADFQPYALLDQITPERVAKYDARRDPFLAYGIRMRSILQAWEPIWNGLAQDPQYGGATRVLFSDHGERFYHVTPELRLGGVHGYNLDPWETRAMLKVAGPGFDAGPGAPRPDTISLLSLRDGFAQAITEGGTIRPATLERAYAEAPMRYQTVDVEMFTREVAEYRQMDVNTLVKGTSIAPNGIWFTEYSKTREERAQEVSVGWGRGPNLEVFRPLKAGGAHRYRYEGYNLKTIDTVSEEAYQREKDKAAQILAPRPLPER